MENFSDSFILKYDSCLLNQFKRVAVILSIMLLLSGCGNDNNDNEIEGTDAPAVYSSIIGESYVDASGRYSAVVTMDGTSFIISGKVSYEDRIFSHDKGIYGTEAKPVRNAVIQVVPDGAGTYYLRCITTNPSRNLRVTDLSGNMYAFRSVNMPMGTDAAVDLYAQGQNAEPFNIFDAATDAFLYAKDLTSGWFTAPLTLIWEDGSIYGTNYDSTHNTVYVLGHAADDDGWDDVVLLHDIGHFISDEYSRDDSLGGEHFINLSNDKRLAWTEGWATYFALQVMAWRDQGSSDYIPGYYIDTTGGNGAGNILIMYEVETPNIPGFPSVLGGDSSEVTVSAVLWDITDNPVSDDDSVSADTETVWDVVTNYIPLKTNVSFETFWDGWGEFYQFLYNIVPILQGHSIEYWEDDYEPAGAIDNTVSYSSTDVSTSIGKHFTYYPSLDEDWISFQAAQGSTYEIQTFNILGADTYLELYSPGMVSVASDDDIVSCPDKPYEQSCRASSIFFTAQTGGKYYLRSYTSPWNYYSYGSYDLRVCQGTCP
jgi:hypothetical protein